jgi:hypothetical protein
MPCFNTVPISIIPPVSQGVAPILWQNGNQITRLNIPLNPSFLIYDGTVTRWGDGSAQAPVYLPNIQEVNSPAVTYVAGITSTGQLVKTLGASGTALIGGSAGSVVYQTAPSATGFTAVGTAGQLLSSNGASAPTWLNQSSIAAGSATTATNIASGVAGAVPYQTAPSTTGFTAAGTSGQVLLSNGTSAPTWTTNIAGNAGTATQLQTSRTLGISGDVTGTASFDGSANATIAGTIANNAVTSAKLGATERLQLCKAWVNFDGTTATPSTIRSSYNVSSVTKFTAGSYQVNFATALADANYSVVGSTNTSNSGTSFNFSSGSPSQTTSGFQYQIFFGVNGFDMQAVNIQVFGN